MEQFELKGAGTLQVRVEGIRVHILATRVDDGLGLYKVWVVGGAGGRVLLGTMMPEGGVLRVRRTMSLQQLQGQNCWPITGGEAVVAFAFSKQGNWRKEPNPQQLVSDPLVRSQMRGSMLYEKNGDGFSLAAPFRTDAPLPMEVLFCLAQPEYIQGQIYLMWIFDEKGFPKVPHK